MSGGIHMYNQERKVQFLKERKAAAEIGANTEAWFNETQYYEEIYKRDLCDWTITEIINFMKYISTPRSQTLVLLKNSFEMYTNWCLSNNLVADNQNHYTEIDSDIIAECVDFEKLKLVTFTREELLSNIKDLPNYVDKFLFLGIFEGISPKNGAITEVKESDLKDGNKLELKSGVLLTISDELKHIIIQAAEEDDYYSMGNRQLVMNYEKGDTIIRPLKRKNPQKNKTIMIGTRFRTCLKYLGMSPGVTLKDISESGRLDFIKRMMKEKNITKEQSIMDKEYRTIHEEIYGAIQNCTMYLKIYGRFL